MATKGIKIDGRPNTKIDSESYEILKEQFVDDVEQHKRSAEISQARREEKEAIQAEVHKIEQKKNIVKAVANFTKPKMVACVQETTLRRVRATPNAIKTKNIVV